MITEEYIGHDITNTLVHFITVLMAMVKMYYNYTKNVLMITEE
jgi:hypothetical protein